MMFEFRIESNGTIAVTGAPADGSHADMFQRSGSYRLEGDQLSSPVLNQGQPIRVRLQGGNLFLSFDESLVFELRRA
ncbi:MAG TPA: hypothetical protein VKU02_23640 [Gemmataceae bacterium]|nr:hypothetical protein [Gemmataceae bacterium]